MFQPRQWDILQVRWQHLDDGTNKPRPVVVVSKNSDIDRYDTISVIKLTSVKPSSPHVFELNPFDPAFAATGLTKTSYFHLDAVRTIKKSDIITRRGHLQLLTQVALRMLIRKATGIDC